MKTTTLLYINTHTNFLFFFGFSSDTGGIPSRQGNNFAATQSALPALKCLNNQCSAYNNLYILLIFIHLVYLVRGRQTGLIQKVFCIIKNKQDFFESNGNSFKY